jgi:hypothetical protein
MLGWTLNQQNAQRVARIHPDRMHVLRTEDVIADPASVLGRLCEALGLERADGLRRPSWNGVELEEVYPWGTIRSATSASNIATAQELDETDRARVRERAWPFLETLDYASFI